MIFSVSVCVCTILKCNTYWSCAASDAQLQWKGHTFSKRTVNIYLIYLFFCLSFFTDWENVLLKLLAFRGRLKLRLDCACLFRYRCLLLNGRAADCGSGLRQAGKAAKTQRRPELRQATGSTKNSSLCLCVSECVCITMAYILAND